MRNPTLGLVPMFLSVLRIRLMELDTVLGAATGHAAPPPPSFLRSMERLLPDAETNSNI